MQCLVGSFFDIKQETEALMESLNTYIQEGDTLILTYMKLKLQKHLALQSYTKHLINNKKGNINQINDHFIHTFT